MRHVVVPTLLGVRLPNADYDAFTSNGLMDGSNPTDTQWIGYITGTGTLHNGSAVLTDVAYNEGTPDVGDVVYANGALAGIVLAYDLALFTLTLDTVQGSNTVASLKLTGQNHVYPTNPNGSWMFGLNMYSAFSYLHVPGPFSAGVCSIVGTALIELLDPASVVLTTADIACDFDFNNVGPLPNIPTVESVGVASFSEDDVSEATGFSGVRFSFTGDDTCAPFHFSIRGTLWLVPASVQISDV